jgi:hypothetical protein|tara:strand:+ start:20587 stop:20802 length:216 start_codon:yes stop_codon:yes gene_type:complete
MSSYNRNPENSSANEYRGKVLEMSPILENAPELLVRGDAEHVLSSYVGRSRSSASPNQPRPCKAKSLERKV